MRDRFTFTAFALLFTLALPRVARAATRTFSATLTKVPGCATASPSGSVSLSIDDVSGAVSGTLVLAGFDASTITSSGIHNKNAGDNLVGPFMGVDASNPNKSHSVTTTLNSIALPKILAGDGAIIVKSSATGCFAGAARGDLVEGGGPADAGASDTAPPVPATDAAASDAATAADGAASPDSGATSAADRESDGGGCAVSATLAPGASTNVMGIVAAVMLGLRRRRRG